MLSHSLRRSGKHACRASTSCRHSHTARQAETSKEQHLPSGPAGVKERSRELASLIDMITDSRSNESLSLGRDSDSKASPSSANSKRPKPSASDSKRIRDTSKHLLSGLKQADNPEWHNTYGRSRNAARLRQALLDGTPKNPVDEIIKMFEDSSLESMTFEDMMQSTTLTVSPGTYFEMRRNADSITGVVLGEVFAPGTSNNLRALTPRGEAATLRVSDIMFAVPNFVDADLISRCGMGEEHADEHELQARLRVLQSLKRFERKVEQEQFRFGRAIRDAYEKLRHRSPDEWGKVTTMHVARLLSASPNVPLITLYAIHKQLMDRPEEFVCHPSRHRFVHSFDVRPLAQREIINQISKWTLEKNPIIAQFQEKARKLIDKSRKIRSESNDGSMAAEVALVDEKFTNEEMTIIEFLKLYVSSKGRNTQLDPFEAHAPAILKDVRRYDGELVTAFLSLKFLREIGIWTPWEDTTTKAKELYMSEHAFRIHPALNRLSKATSVTEANTPGLLTEDTHESVRFDFGDMPVFVIDDATAEELDDGISVERIANEPDCAWLHMHIADPTAVVPITHSLSRVIQKRPESLYFFHKTIPMLPTDISRIADMGKAGVQKNGQNVLTFSAKVDSKGQILDYKVRAGRVKNVMRFTYEGVNDALGFKFGDEHFLPFEGRSMPMKADQDISQIAPYAEDLRLVFDLTRGFVKDRMDKGTFTFSSAEIRVDFLDKPVLENPTNLNYPIFYRGYPRLQYRRSDTLFSELGSHSIVSECMKIAARVASRFCSEHHIPAIRRGMPRPKNADDSTMARVLDHRNEFGFVDSSILAKEGVIFQAGDLTLEPAAHWGLAIPEGEGYIRATSPLRRADDMIAHWQIKSVLSPFKQKPLTELVMKKIAEELSCSLQAFKVAKRAHMRQWAHEYIIRFLEQQKRLAAAGVNVDDKPNPLRNIEGSVVTDVTYNTVMWEAYQDVALPDLGLRGFLPLANVKEPFEIGTKLRVNVTQVFQHDLNHNLLLELA